MKLTTRVVAFFSAVLFVTGAPDSKTEMIAYCANDSADVDLPEDAHAVTIPGPRELTLRANADARFDVGRNGRSLYQFRVKDFYNPHGKILWSHDGTAFAIDYSDGGAIGVFHVRVFLVRGDTIVDATDAIRPAVDAFKSRHFCKSRGNNVTALKWVTDSRDLLLMTDVYPTSDCGAELGHTEGYVVSVPAGTIESHLTLDQLKRYPGICLEHDDAH
jgi:hypothetical protein